MSLYAIGIGSNRGDRLSNLRFAHREIGNLGTVRATSSLYETAPVGGPQQGPFLNAVVVIEADHYPHALLAGLQSIEAGAGRVRTVRWGPRTLDLDIVAWDGPRVSSDELEIPHPRAHERRFVLEPLSEVWPEAEVGEQSPGELADALPDQGVERVRRNWVGDGDG